MARVRRAAATENPAADTITASKRTRAALKEKTNTVNGSQGRDAPEVGDVSVKEAIDQTRRARNNTIRKEEGSMTGASRSQGSQLPRGGPADLPSNEGAGGDSKVTAGSAAKNVRRPPRMTRRPVRTQASNKAMPQSTKRIGSTASQRATRDDNMPTTEVEDITSSEPLPRGSAMARKASSPAMQRSEVPVSPPQPVPLDMGLANERRLPTLQAVSTAMQHTTPGMERSVLALKNFKRRPRQLSMLAMVQQRVASARPSLVSARPDGDSSGLDLEGDEIEAAFLPEAEGTPMHSVRQRPGQYSRSTGRLSLIDPIQSSTSPQHSRKRKSQELDGSTSASIASRQRNRRSTADGESPAHYEATFQPQPSSQVQVLGSEPSSGPPVARASRGVLNVVRSQDVIVPSTAQEDDRDKCNDATAAEPASSSMHSSPPPATQGGTLIYADPLTQRSPSPPPRMTRTKKARSKPPSTAALQSLLPKRRQTTRQRKQIEYDVSSDSGEESSPEANNNEDVRDELGVGRRKEARTIGTAREEWTAEKGSKQSKRPSNLPRNPGRPTRTQKSTGPPARSRKSTGHPKATETYARTNTSDKENEPYESNDQDEDSGLVDDSTTMQEAAKSTELDAARRKFAEIDQWDMEFESMSTEEHRSSSQGWR